MPSRHTEIDEVVVRRLLRGERGLSPTRAELVAATAILTDEGKKAHVIADRLGKTVRSVERYRADIRAGRFSERLASMGGVVPLAKGGFPGIFTGSTLDVLVVGLICLCLAILIILFGRR